MGHGCCALFCLDEEEQRAERRSSGRRGAGGSRRQQEGGAGVAAERGTVCGRDLKGRKFPGRLERGNGVGEERRKA